MFLLCCIIYSCTPRIETVEDIFINDKRQTQKPKEKKLLILDQNEDTIYYENKISSEIEVILPKNGNKIIIENFINSLELSLYKKNINNLSFNINTYSDEKQLQKILNNTISPGKIFIGPLTSKDSNNIKNECSSGVIFFSFASDRSLASECVYLVNFFPEDDLFTLFNYFGPDTRIALLYPENQYGHYINEIIDEIAMNSRAIIVNKASYKKDLSNAREAIKQLGKYELRRYELERQKRLLEKKEDKLSKEALKKIQRFETIGELDFTHIIIPDHNIRLLEIVPLLPFYDIDPNKIQFVGTGVWDDEAFFHEPSLQRAIFPGIDFKKRKAYIEEYIINYNEQPIRTITMIHDLVGLLNYIIENNLTVESAHRLLQNPEISFEGLDGKFSFNNNLITRNLDILRIENGSASSIK